MDPLIRVAASANRRMKAFRSRRAHLRHRLPPWAPRRYGQLRSKLTECRRAWIPVRHRSFFTRVYHCAVQKTGSQWLGAILSDPQVFRYSGLSFFNYPARVGVDPNDDLRRRTYPHLATERSIVSPLYVTYDNYSRIGDPEPHRAVFVARDPRDLLVSWVFSARRIHVVDNTGELVRARTHLAELDTEAGILYGIDYMQRRGHFDVLRSWAEARDPDVLVVRYEELVGEHAHDSFTALFRFLDIDLPPDVLDELLGAYSFEALTGRSQGTEDRDLPLRRGQPGEWREHFDSEVAARFAAVTGDLCAALGYPD